MNWVGGARNRVRQNPENRLLKRVNNRPYPPHHVAPSPMKVTYRSKQHKKPSHHKDTMSQDLLGLQALNIVHNPDQQLKATEVIHRQRNHTNVDLSDCRIGNFDIELPASPSSQQPSALEFMDAASTDSLSFYSDNNHNLVSTMKRSRDNDPLEYDKKRDSLSEEFDLTFGTEVSSIDSIHHTKPEQLFLGLNAEKAKMHNKMHRGFELSTESIFHPLAGKPAASASKLFQTFDSSINSKPRTISTLQTDDSIGPRNPAENHHHHVDSMINMPFVKPKAPNVGHPLNSSVLDTEKPVPIIVGSKKDHFNNWNHSDWYRNEENRQENCQNNNTAKVLPGKMKPPKPYDKEAPLSSFENRPLNLQALTSFHKSQTNGGMNSISNNNGVGGTNSSLINTSDSFTSGIATVRSSGSTYDEDPMLVRPLPNKFHLNGGQLRSKYCTPLEVDHAPPLIRPHPFNSKPTLTNNPSLQLKKDMSHVKPLSAFEKMILALEGDEALTTISDHDSTGKDTERILTTEEQTTASTGSDRKDMEWITFVNSTDDHNTKPSNVTTNGKHSPVYHRHKQTVVEAPISDIPPICTDNKANIGETILAPKETAVVHLLPEPSIEDPIPLDRLGDEVPEALPICIDQELVLSEDEEFYSTQRFSKKKRGAQHKGIPAFTENKPEKPKAIETDTTSNAEPPISDISTLNCTTNYTIEPTTIRPEEGNDTEMEHKTFEEESGNDAVIPPITRKHSPVANVENNMLLITGISPSIPINHIADSFTQTDAGAPTTFPDRNITETSSIGIQADSHALPVVHYDIGVQTTTNAGGMPFPHCDIGIQVVPDHSDACCQTNTCTQGVTPPIGNRPATMVQLKSNNSHIETVGEVSQVNDCLSDGFQNLPHKKQEMVKRISDNWRIIVSMVTQQQQQQGKGDSIRSLKRVKEAREENRRLTDLLTNDLVYSSLILKLNND